MVEIFLRSIKISKYEAYSFQFYQNFELKNFQWEEEGNIHTILIYLSPNLSPNLYLLVVLELTHSDTPNPYVLNPF